MVHAAASGRTQPKITALKKTRSIPTSSLMSLLRVAASRVLQLVYYYKRRGNRYSLLKRNHPDLEQQVVQQRILILSSIRLTIQLKRISAMTMQNLLRKQRSKGWN